MSISPVFLFIQRQWPSYYSTDTVYMKCCIVESIAWLNVTLLMRCLWKYTDKKIRARLITFTFSRLKQQKRQFSLNDQSDTPSGSQSEGEKEMVLVKCYSFTNKHWKQITTCWPIIIINYNAYKKTIYCGFSCTDNFSVATQTIFWSMLCFFILK